MFKSQYCITPKELHPYLCGVWKRTLEWRNFGDAYQHICTTNTVILIEDVDSDSESQYLNWSFVENAECLDGYKMKLIPDEKGIHLEWNFRDCRCYGRFTGSLLVLNYYFGDGTLICSYQILGPDNMAVCIVESREGENSTIQYGNMLRIRRENYKEHPGLNRADKRAADNRSI